MDRNGLQPYSESVLNGKDHNGLKKRRKEEFVKIDPSPKDFQDRVFVVQFCVCTEPGSARFAGRAEHVMSGQYTGFETPEELVGFLGQVINHLKA